MSDSTDPKTTPGEIVVPAPPPLNAGWKVWLVYAVIVLASVLPTLVVGGVVLNQTTNVEKQVIKVKDDVKQVKDDVTEVKAMTVGK